MKSDWEALNCVPWFTAAAFNDYFKEISMMSMLAQKSSQEKKNNTSFYPRWGDKRKMRND